jgi:hypothetical protein
MKGCARLAQGSQVGNLHSPFVLGVARHLVAAQQGCGRGHDRRFFAGQAPLPTVFFCDSLKHRFALPVSRSRHPRVCVCL